MNTKEKLEALFSFLVLAGVFVFISFFVQKYSFEIKHLVLDAPFFVAELIYVFLGFLATVVAPISSLPLVPVASFAFGWKLTAILNLFSWTLGSLASFFLARKYGKPIVAKFISLKKIEKVEEKIPKDNIFWSVVFLRIIIPVDLLSYAIGIFTKMKVKDYILSTIMGIAPFSFIFAYAGSLSVKNQVVFLLLFSFLFLSLFLLKSIYFKFFRKEKSRVKTKTLLR